MPDLLVKPAGDHGRVVHITPESAGWTYVGFDLQKLGPGETLSAETGDREICLVLISGKAAIRAGGQDFGTLGERMSPFEGKPAAVYVPGDSNWAVTAATEVTLAVCSAPGPAASRRPGRSIPPPCRRKCAAKAAIRAT